MSTVEQHLSALYSSPSGPDATDPDPKRWAEAAEAVGMRMLRNGRAVYAILADNTAIAAAVRELVLEKSRDVTTIANHVEALREAVRDAAREWASDWSDEMVSEQYAINLRAEVSGE